MAILYDSATGRYIEVSPNDLRNLAQNMPSVNAQYAYMNGVDRIGVRGITPNLLAVPKTGTIHVYNGSWISDAFTTTNVRAGQSIGVTTGVEAYKGWGIYGYLCVEVQLQVKLGANNIGTRVFIDKNDLDLKAPSSSGSGDILFPISFGSKNSAVAEFQGWLKNCGYFSQSFVPDGDWGTFTQAGAQKEGIVSINSRAELNSILARPCRNAGGGSSGGGGGGGGVTPIDTNPVVVPPAPVQDNTWMYVAGAVGVAVVVKSMQGKKKKKKKNAKST